MQLQTNRPASLRPDMTDEIMRQTGLNDDNLTALVHRFYQKVRADQMLAPIFAEHVQDWDAHLARLVEFWSSVALMTGRYHGAPVIPHLDMPIGAVHFARWLALFRETAAETCPTTGAAHLVERAERIARAFQMAIATHTAEKSNQRKDDAQLRSD